MAAPTPTKSAIIMPQVAISVTEGVNAMLPPREPLPPEIPLTTIEFAPAESETPETEAILTIPFKILLIKAVAPLTRTDVKSRLVTPSKLATTVVTTTPPTPFAGSRKLNVSVKLPVFATVSPK